MNRNSIMVGTAVGVCLLLAGWIVIASSQAGNFQPGTPAQTPSIRGEEAAACRPLPTPMIPELNGRTVSGIGAGVDTISSVSPQPELIAIEPRESSSEPRVGGVRLYIDHPDGQPVMEFSVSISQNPFPSAQGSWSSGGLGVSNGGSETLSSNRDGMCMIPAHWAPRCGLMIIVPDSPPFLAEGLRCPPLGSETDVVRLRVSKGPAASVRALIIAANEEPWREGYVKVVPEAGHENHGLAMWMRGAARTGKDAESDGTYRVANVPPCSRATIEVCFGSQVIAIERIGPLYDEQETYIVIRLPELSPLSIDVHWNGRPLEGVVVLASADSRVQGRRPEGYPGWHSVTGATGRVAWMIPAWIDELNSGLFFDSSACGKSRAGRLRIEATPGELDLAERVLRKISVRSHTFIRRPFASLHGIDVSEAVKIVSQDPEQFWSDLLSVPWNQAGHGAASGDGGEWRTAFDRRDISRMVEISLQVIGSLERDAK